MAKVKGKLYDLDKNLDNYLLYNKEEMIKKEIYIDGEIAGHEKGREEGRSEERQSTIALLKQLLKSGVNLELIKKNYNLTDEEIRELKESLN